MLHSKTGNITTCYQWPHYSVITEFYHLIWAGTCYSQSCPHWIFNSRKDGENKSNWFISQLRLSHKLLSCYYWLTWQKQQWKLNFFFLVLSNCWFLQSSYSRFPIIHYCSHLSIAATNFNKTLAFSLYSLVSTWPWVLKQFVLFQSQILHI